jgi:putative ABC transport system permease protein
MVNYLITGIIRNFTQYILAIIGLIIGITSLIAVGYLGIVNKIKLYDEIEKQGINLIFIYPESASSTPERRNFSGQYPALKNRELTFLKSNLLYNDRAIPAKYFVGNVKFGSHSINNVEIIGTTSGYLSIMNYKIFYGSNFKENIKGVFIGYTIFKELFNKNINVIGKRILIGKRYFQIVGILGETGVSSSGRDKDNIVILPIKHFSEHIKNSDYFDTIYLKPVKLSFLAGLKKSAIMLLRILKNNSFSTLKPMKFSVKSMDYYIKKQQKVGNLLVITTLIVSSITLLVGGLGVMAVMLILGIKERREIGIKRAVGATKLNIFLEYIVKSFTIAFFSSVLGLIFGVVAYFLINKIYHAAAPFPVGYSFIGIVSTFLISILFGLYPAYKASKIEPSSALRYQ